MAKRQEKNLEESRSYFVDEAGDLTLFDRHGRSLVGTSGCSHFFMLGIARIPELPAIGLKLAELRARLLADPYFRNVPSLRPEERKTAICFHAKDDLAEVRKEVFDILRSFSSTKVLAAIRTKRELASDARVTFQGKRLLPVEPDSIYDDLVKRLFKNQLHQSLENRIIFARRGNKDRIESLARAITRAKDNFARQWRRPIDQPTFLESKHPSEQVGLQVVDYYLWALQRLYERREDRFFEALRPAYKIIMDLDDTREKRYGAWYTSDNPLTLEKIKPL